MAKIHLRDEYLKVVAIHFDYRIPDVALTSDVNKVTCKRCLAMIKRWKEQSKHDT